MTRRTAPLSFIMLSAALVGTSLATSAPPASRGPGPVVATEDTMHTEVPPVLVNAPRVTLDEILDRVARGEARRDSLMHDQAFLSTVRVVGNSAGAKPQLLEENVAQVYRRRPDRVRVIQLRHWEYKPDKKKDSGDNIDLGLDYSPRMNEEIVNFAFQPRARREFKFTILGRDLIGDHLIYRLGFEPRSALDVFKPSGKVWVDTREFVILRQEIEFRQSPVPLFLKGIRRMVIERQQVGEYWVMRDMLLRIETTIPIPKFGRTFDIGIQQTDYAVNAGVADSVFVVPAKPSGARQDSK